MNTNRIIKPLFPVAAGGAGGAGAFAVAAFILILNIK
jgi:hypothetical protein